jgi:hypothetical protein
VTIKSLSNTLREGVKTLTRETCMLAIAASKQRSGFGQFTIALNLTRSIVTFEA